MGEIMEKEKFVIYQDEFFMFFVLVAIWITIGDPDIIDALIHFLMK